MRRLAAVVLIAVLSVAVTASAAPAAIKILKIEFDPPGADTGSSESLKKEIIVLKNTGRTPKSIEGWRIIDESADHRYRFGEGIVVEPGAVVRLHTGSGNDGYAPKTGRYDLYWGLDAYIWNNDGDTAKLRKGDGTLIDRCKYSGSQNPARC